MLEIPIRANHEEQRWLQTLTALRCSTGWHSTISWHDRYLKRVDDHDFLLAVLAPKFTSIWVATSKALRNQDFANITSISFHLSQAAAVTTGTAGALYCDLA